jgi:hypothetical protein
VRPSIPKATIVDAGFRLLENRLRIVRRRVNNSAAKEMRAGEYLAAKAWMDLGQTVADFASRVDAFAQEWKRLVKTARIVLRSNGENGHLPRASGAKGTPIWRFCQPMLRALVDRGGSGTVAELLPALEQDLAGVLNETDLSALPAKGVPRWHQSVVRAARHCQREGWAEKRGNGVWRVTAKGKVAAADVTANS